MCRPCPGHLLGCRPGDVPGPLGAAVGSWLCPPCVPGELCLCWEGRRPLDSGDLGGGGSTAATEQEAGPGRAGGQCPWGRGARSGRRMGRFARRSLAGAECLEGSRCQGGGQEVRAGAEAFAAEAAAGGGSGGGGPRGGVVLSSHQVPAAPRRPSPGARLPFQPVPLLSDPSQGEAAHSGREAAARRGVSRSQMLICCPGPGPRQRWTGGRYPMSSLSLQPAATSGSPGTRWCLQGPSDPAWFPPPTPRGAGPAEGGQPHPGGWVAGAGAAQLWTGA